MDQVINKIVEWLNSVINLINQSIDESFILMLKVWFVKFLVFIQKAIQWLINRL